MKIKLSTNLTKPGEKCQLDFSTSPNSFVALLAVDESVTLLGTGNDLDQNKIAKELAGYDLIKNFPPLVINGSDTERYLDFGESNAFIITNALEGSFSCAFKNRFNPITHPVEDDDDISGITDGAIDPHDPEKPRIRKNFAETWIFEDFQTDDNGNYSLVKKVPDTITSFIVTGFVINPEDGLGIAAQQKITVFQEFFLKLYLPYSIRFGEILKVDVSVFNYIKKPRSAVTATVTMFNNQREFEFIEVSQANNICQPTASNEMKKTKSLSVKSGTGGSTYFLIRTLVTGSIKIRVRAATSEQGDEVEKTLNVENEGVTDYRNVAQLFDLRKKQVHSFEFIVTIPQENIIPRSIKIEASVIGDLLGPALKNIQSMV